MMSLTLSRTVAAGLAVTLTALALCAAEGDQPPLLKPAAEPTPLPGTLPLTMTGDIASNLVAGVDRFLLRELELSVSRRAEHWRRDFMSPAAYTASLSTNRQRLAHILGARDPRIEFAAPEIIGTTAGPALAAQGGGFEVFAVRWPVFGDVHGEGLLLVPQGKGRVADIIAIPDADQTPEQLAGLAEGVPPESQFARRLAESGCRVLVPALINRGVTHNKLSNREFLYRSAYELGRHLVGYELQKVLAGVDWFAREAAGGQARIGVFGWGEGALLALYAGALDTRIGAVGVSGYFGRREGVWQEPIYRNVFGLLEQFGDAELAAMIAPRVLIIEAAKGPEVLVPPGTGGGPGRLATPTLESVEAEFTRAQHLVAGLAGGPALHLVRSGDGAGPYGSVGALPKLLGALAPGAALAASGGPPTLLRKDLDPQARHRAQMYELDRHNQWLLA